MEARPIKKPLIIKGARQVGKTYVIREFAKEAYDDLIEIKFERETSLIELFKRTKEPKELLEYFKRKAKELSPIHRGVVHKYIF